MKKGFLGYCLFLVLYFISIGLNAQTNEQQRLVGTWIHTWNDDGDEEWVFSGRWGISGNRIIEITDGKELAYEYLLSSDGRTLQIKNPRGRWIESKKDDNYSSSK